MIKLLVDEPGSEIAHAALSEADFVSTSALARVEATATLTRMRRGGRISSARFDTALEELELHWDSFYVHAVTESLVEMASVTARDHALRAYDALHLASIAAFEEVRQLTFACWDGELRNAAQDRGIALVPERV